MEARGSQAKIGEESWTKAEQVVFTPPSVVAPTFFQRAGPNYVFSGLYKKRYDSSHELRGDQRLRARARKEGSLLGPWPATTRSKPPTKLCLRRCTWRIFETTVSHCGSLPARS